MTSESTNDRQASSTTTTNQRPFRSDLLTKIYYPDSLYPDSYTFFADRTDTVRSSRMNTQDQYQSATTDSTRPSINAATIPKQAMTENEMIERHSKTPVSVGFFSF
jgi:hypothetical protein